MFKVLTAVALTLSLLVATSAEAGYSCLRIFRGAQRSPIELTFGPEFSFTNEELIRVGNRVKQPEFPENVLKLEELELLYKDKCVSGECKLSYGHDKHGRTIKVTFLDGWYLVLSLDMCALEVQTKPTTLEDFKRHMPRLKEVFAMMKTVGLEPHTRVGGGHIHMGMNAIQDRLLLRNFFVDYANFPELAFGALGNHLYNSPSLAAQKPEQRRALDRILEYYDTRSYLGAKDFARKIQDEVYTSTFKYDHAPDHYQAIRVERVLFPSRSATVEVRAFRPQESPEHFLLQLELLQDRINFLADNAAPVRYASPSKFTFEPQEIVDGFHEYVIGMGGSWERYKILLPKELREIRPSGNQVERQNENESVPAPPLGRLSREQIAAAGGPATQPSLFDSFFRMMCPTCW